jgi:hypothetical protein
LKGKAADRQKLQEEDPYIRGKNIPSCRRKDAKLVLLIPALLLKKE